MYVCIYMCKHTYIYKNEFEYTLKNTVHGADIAIDELVIVVEKEQIDGAKYLQSFTGKKLSKTRTTSVRPVHNVDMTTDITVHEFTKQHGRRACSQASLQI